MKIINALSLFSGIGGLDLGLQRAGMNIVGHVEIDPYCQRVLAKNFPGVPLHDDVRTAVQWWESQARPDVHLVAGGFPCQPVSVAGRKRGADDERWLWPEMLRVITSLRPEWVVFENVLGLRTRGLDAVVSDLAEAGYTTDVKAHSACAVGAPHMRRRLLGVAHAHGFDGGARRAWGPAGQGADGADQPTPGMGGAADIAQWWAAEPGVDRVAHGVPHGVDRLRGLGNAVVPQVAEHVGRLIMEAVA